MVKQIDSLITYDEAEKTMDAGANCIGLIPMQNAGVLEHQVPLITVDKIFNEAKARGVKAVATMLTSDPQEILALTKRLRPDIVHVASGTFAATAQFASQIKEVSPQTKLMQAVLVDDALAIDRAQHYAQFADYLILNSGLGADTGIGASGLTHDWNIDAEIVRRVQIPVVICGGLGPDNVAQAISQTKPFGVSSMTKTTKFMCGGRMYKDFEKVSEFCQLADEAAAKMGL